MITNEIKAKVFAQYLGQKITAGQQNPPILSFSTDSENLSVEGAVIMSTYKLVLKPLSAISDEDAVEVAKICKVSDSDFYTDQFGIYRKEGKDGNDVLRYHLVGKAYIKYLFKKGDRVWYSNPNVFIQVSQFLQSRGYDLPQYLLNNQTLKEAGLAVYE